MKYVIVDTEGSGLFDYALPADAPGQPRMASIALIYLDETFAETDRKLIYVKPEGWAMKPDATAVNGLTDEFLLANGQPVSVALDAYEAAVLEGRAVVAFGAQHDAKQLRAEFRRAGRDDLFEQTPNLCMMRVMNGVCKLTAEGSNRRKFPKLSEAMAHFKREQTSPHKAMGDAEDCLFLFRKGHELGLHMTPEVHHAKAGTKAGDAAGLPRPAKKSRKAAAPDPMDLPFTDEAKRAAPGPASAEDEIPE